MNKMLFSEGGQPLYIDDLKLLQENPRTQLGLLLQALSAGNSVFLLNRIQGDIISTDAKTGKTTFRIKQNWLVLNDVIYEITEKTLTLQEWDTPLYVGVKHVKSELRTFENGQEYACRDTSEAYLTLEKTEGVYEISKLKTLFELMAPLVAEKVPVNEYKDIQVTFLNGYAGLLQYKEESDYYRVRLKVTSSTHRWTEAKGMVFSFSEKTPKWLNDTISEGFVTGGDTSARAEEARIIIKDENATFTGSLELDDSANGPSGCPIKTFFIIPK